MGLTRQERQDRLWDRAIKIRDEANKERAFKSMLEACKEAKVVLLKVYKDDKGVDIFNALGLLDNAIKQGEAK